MKLFRLYIIRHWASGKAYAGYTSRTTEQRFGTHLDNAARGIETHLYRAIRKYGRNAFHIETMKLLPTQEEAHREERRLIKEWNLTDDRFGYNMTEGGHGGAPVASVRRVMSQKAKARLTPSELAKRSADTKAFFENNPLSAEDRRKFSKPGVLNPWFGKGPTDGSFKVGHKHSPEVIEKLRRASTGKRPSAETRAKMSAAHKARHERNRSGLVS